MKFRILNESFGFLLILNFQERKLEPKHNGIKLPYWIQEFKWNKTENIYLWDEENEFIKAGRRSHDTNKCFICTGRTQWVLSWLKKKICIVALTLLLYCRPNWPILKFKNMGKKCLKYIFGHFQIFSKWPAKIKRWQPWRKGDSSLIMTELQKEVTAAAITMRSILSQILIKKQMTKTLVMFLQAGYLCKKMFNPAIFISM